MRNNYLLIVKQFKSKEFIHPITSEWSDETYNLIGPLQVIRSSLRVLISFVSHACLLCFLLLGLLCACQNEPNSTATTKEAFTIPNTPESICRLWQKVLDNNEIDKALLLGSPATKAWLLENKDLIVDNGMNEATQFIDMTCQESADKAICKYTLQEDGDLIEDYFSLLRLDNQWLIHIEESASNDPEELIFEQMKKSLELE